MKYNLVNYFDVWGNEEDGYEINDWSYPHGRDFQYEIDGEDIIGSLISDGYLNELAREGCEIEDECNGIIMIYEKKNRKPLYCLEYEC